MLYVESVAVCLTHDVDSITRPLLHVLRRGGRFAPLDLLKHLAGLDNLYDNIRLIMDFEDDLDIRSTWFFPPFLLPLERVEDYVKDLVKGGWEVGLHAVAGGAQSSGLLKMQVEYMRDFLDLPLRGVRFHGLIYSRELLSQLASMGFIYDSSARVEEVGYRPFRVAPGMVELPLYVMDADLFGRLKLSEDRAWRYILWKLGRVEEVGVEVVVVLFHQESFRMKGGRLYSRLAEWVLEKGWSALTCVEAVRRLGEVGCGCHD